MLAVLGAVAVVWYALLYSGLARLADKPISTLEALKGPISGSFPASALRPGRVPAGAPGSFDSRAPKNLQTADGVTLQPAALRAFQAAQRCFGGPIRVTGSFRSRAQQTALHNAKPGLAAAPGHSMHELGLAIDVDTGAPNQAKIRACLTANNWHQFSVSREPWHYSYGVTG